MSVGRKGGVIASVVDPKNRRSLAWLAVVFLLLPIPGWAQSGAKELAGHSLTLKEVTDYALSHNRSVLAAKQDTAVADQQVRQAKSDFYPKLDSKYTFQQTSDQPYAKFSNSAGMTQKYYVNTSATNRWEINLSQSLFTGFRLTSKLNISKMEREISELRLDEARTNLVRDVHYAFFQTLLAEKLSAVARDNVRSLDAQRKNALAQYQQGLTAQNDVLKAEVALAHAQQQERSTAKQLVVLRSRLNQLLDLDVQTRLELSEEDVTPHVIPVLEDLYSRAEKRRPEYHVIETSIRQAREGITVAKSRYYPHVSLFGQYYREGEDFLAETNDYANSQNAAVGVRVEWNWFEGGKTDASTNEWRYRQASLEEKREDLKQQIRLQVEDAYEQIKVADANIVTARAALKQAEENERMTSLQYKEQLVIFLEVLNAQVFVAQSRADYYQALYGYQLAWADLERAVGGPLER